MRTEARLTTASLSKRVRNVSYTLTSVLGQSRAQLQPVTREGLVEASRQLIVAQDDLSNCRTEITRAHTLVGTAVLQIGLAQKIRERLQSADRELHLLLQQLPAHEPSKAFFWIKLLWTPVIQKAVVGLVAAGLLAGAVQMKLIDADAAFNSEDAQSPRQPVVK